MLVIECTWCPTSEAQQRNVSYEPIELRGPSGYRCHGLCESVTKALEANRFAPPTKADQGGFPAMCFWVYAVLEIPRDTRGIDV